MLPPRGRAARPKLVRVKVISMGDVGVGKSCLIKRYCEERFVSRYIPTIGVDYGVKPLQYAHHQVNVNLWDLAGPPEYLAVRSEFYRDAQGALLAYDATNRASFEALCAWLDEARAHGAPDSLAVFVAATKVDLPGRRVQREEGREWAAARGLPYFEVSAATGQGVQPLFAALFAAVLRAAPGAPAEAVKAAADEASRAASGGGGGGGGN